AAVSLIPSAAHAAACSPLNCAASQFSLADGSLLGFRARADAPVNVVDLKTGQTRWTLPSGVVGGNLLAHQDGMSIVWYDASRGTTPTARVTLATVGSLGGVSQDGSGAVFMRISPGGTTFTIVSGSEQRDVVVPGRPWDFDALRGNNLFLIRYLK